MTDQLDDPSGGGAPAPTSDDTHAPLPEQGGQGRDDAGRFAPGQPDPGQDGGQAPQGYVPHQALHASRQEAREAKDAAAAAQRELAELRAQFQGFTQAQRPPEPPKAPEAPDPWSQPAEYARWAAEQATQPIAQQQGSHFAAVSTAIANQMFGEDKVQAADTALGEFLARNPHMKASLQARIMRPGALPHVEVVKWHREQSALSQVGDDPNAYIEAEIARRMAAMGGGAAPSPQPAPPQPTMPSSFTGAPSQGPRGAANMGTGPRPLSAIMGR